MGVLLGRLLSSRYRVIRALGAGGFGHTYIAEDTQRPGHPTCVLKHLSFDSTKPEVLQQARRMFWAEAETLEALGRHDQIPQLLAYFEEDEEFYLVQEFIQGHPLTDELPLGKKLSEPEVVSLLEDVLQVLEFVHARGVIHRDIKPDNIIRRERDHKLVLIDFGAVKHLETTIAESTNTTQMSLPVYTSGYAASEQCLGKPRFSSDLYALGVIGIQALTGMRPAQLPQDANTCELVWRDHATVSQALAEVLEQMTRFHFNQRYESATAALQALQPVKHADRSLTQMPLSQVATDRPQELGHRFAGLPTRQQTETHPQTNSSRRLLTPIKLAAGVGVAAILSVATWFGVRSFLPADDRPLSDTPREGSFISFGARALTPGTSRPSKQEAVDQFASGNFPTAVNLLEKARQENPADPETLIYLNNARIGNGKSYAIGVAVPLSTNPRSASEILRGVAQAQQQVNQQGGINGTPLRVAIANDESQPKLAKQVAAELASDPSILGVVGHGTSDTTLSAATVYQQQELAVVSPVSSAVQLTGFGPYLFRTMPSDQHQARQLSDYMLTTLKQTRAAVFFNSGSTYSRSLKDAFKASLFYGGRGEVVAELDLSNPDFNPVENVGLAIKKGAQVLMLAPDHEAMDRALLVMQVNANRLPLLAGDTLYSNRTVQVGNRAALGMVLAMPFYSVEGSAFQKRATALWQKPITWRTILSYDATQALIVAIGRSPTRNGVQATLADPQFAATGATSRVSFLPTGDRQETNQLLSIQLVKVVPTKSKREFEFQPINPKK